MMLAYFTKLILERGWRWSLERSAREKPRAESPLQYCTVPRILPQRGLPESASVNTSSFHLPEVLVCRIICSHWFRAEDPHVYFSLSTVRKALGGALLQETQELSKWSTVQRRPPAHLGHPEFSVRLAQHLHPFSINAASCPPRISSERS